MTEIWCKHEITEIHFKKEILKTTRTNPKNKEIAEIDSC